MDRNLMSYRGSQKSIWYSSSQGFTMIELMIVVSIIGILAAIAIPSFLKFVRQSKTSEAPINIKAISEGAVSWFDTPQFQATNGNPMRKHFPHDGNSSQVLNGPTTLRRPSEAPCVKGRPQYKVDSKQWEAFPWKRLKFGINRPHYYQYQYTYNNSDVKSPSFTVAAHADLDCDTTVSTYTLQGKAHPVTGEVELTNLLIIDPLE